MILLKILVGIICFAPFVLALFIFFGFFVESMKDKYW